MNREDISSGNPSFWGPHLHVRIRAPLSLTPLLIITIAHTRTHTHTHRFAHTQTYSPSDALTHGLTRTLTHPITLDHNRTPSQFRLNHTQTHSYSDSLIRSPSRSDLLMRSLTHTQTHSYSEAHSRTPIHSHTQTNPQTVPRHIKMAPRPPRGANMGPRNPKEASERPKEPPRSAQHGTQISPRQPQARAIQDVQRSSRDVPKRTPGGPPRGNSIPPPAMWAQKSQRAKSGALQEENVVLACFLLKSSSRHPKRARTELTSMH